MAEGRDEVCRVTVEPLPADHKSLQQSGFRDIDWKSGVRLTVPRWGCLGVDRYIVRCAVMVGTGEHKIFVCPESEGGRFDEMLSPDEARRIVRQHKAELLPHLPTCGLDLIPECGPESGEEN